MADTRDVVQAGVRSRGFFGAADGAKELRPRTYFLAAFGNISAFETDEGLLVVDTGIRQLAESNHAEMRKVTDAPLHTAVYTHGHVDHAFGLGPWLAEAREAGRRRPRIVAHRNVVDRFHTYRRMGGLNEHINSVQFGITDVEWPSTFDWPDTTYEEALTLTIGGERFELRHGKGETDDATWVWAPERGVLCTGDFWINCAPNCGNPQKVQRYPLEWIDTLERMAALGAELLLPGHGRIIEGVEEIRDALTAAAAYLQTICDQTIERLNEGLPHDEIVAGLEIPEHLATNPHLQPIYDRPEFIVRNLIRRLGGWWDGYPSSVMPALEADQAREVAALAGGVDVLVRRARTLVDEHDLVMACHVAEWAALADPENRAALECVRDVFGMRAEEESSLMGRGIFMHAVRKAEAALDPGS